VHDITTQFKELASTASRGGDGLLHVFVPHPAAGVAVIEPGAGSDVDLLAAAWLLWAARQLKGFGVSGQTWPNRHLHGAV
jgi:thiamine phosphate synthase YjbQ (UPF0047 family)